MIRVFLAGRLLGFVTHRSWNRSPSGALVSERSLQELFYLEVFLGVDLEQPYGMWQNTSRWVPSMTQKYKSPLQYEHRKAAIHPVSSTDRFIIWGTKEHWSLLPDYSESTWQTFIPKKHKNTLTFVSPSAVLPCWSRLAGRIQGKKILTRICRMK